VSSTSISRPVSALSGSSTPRYINKDNNKYSNGFQSKNSLKMNTSITNFNLENAEIKSDAHIPEEWVLD